MAKKIPVYLLLLPFFFVLHNYNELFGFIQVKKAISFLFMTIAWGGLCFLIVYLFARSLPLSAVATFLILAFVLYFGALHDGIKFITNNSVLSSYKIVILVACLLIAWGIYYFSRHPASIQKFIRYLTVLLILLCVVEVFFSFIKYNRYTKDHNLIYPQKPICDRYVPCAKADSLKPDIYFLIFDAYTNDSTLRTLWKFDNSDMTDWFTGKGFRVIPHSRCNYYATVFSISSTFNMNYIDKENGHIGTAVNNLQAQASLSNNETFCILNKENYTIRFLAPFSNRIENNGLSGFFDKLYTDQLYMATLPGRIQKDLLWNVGKWKKKLKANEPSKPDPIVHKNLADMRLTVEKIKETVNSSSSRPPQFVYGHFMITHEPFVFDSTGHVITGPVNYSYEYMLKTYPWQVSYANKVIKDLVDFILDNNKKNTIVIVQGDHGFNAFQHTMPGYGFPNLNAMYFPDSNYTRLSDKMTSINTFRVIFNQYFCQNLKLLKDSSFLITEPK